MIDTHTHIYVEEFQKDVDEVIDRALKSGVEKMYMPAIDSGTHDCLVALERRFPLHCRAMMGLHPCSVKENYEQELEIVHQYLKQHSFAAIGEIGLDFYWDKTYVNEQYLAFRQQIEWALQYDYPIVIHSRNATRECIDVVREFSSKGLKGIFHCFGGTLEEAKDIIDVGFLMGIGGVLTYKNSGLQQVMKHIDLKHIVLETDAPYLTPVPHRGKRNEPSYIRFVADKLAEVKGISLDEVVKITTANAIGLFKN